MAPKIADSKTCNCPQCNGKRWLQADYQRHVAENAQALAENAPVLPPDSAAYPPLSSRPVVAHVPLDILTPDITSLGTRPPCAHETREIFQRSALSELLVKSCVLERECLEWTKLAETEESVPEQLGDYVQLPSSGKRKQLEDVAHPKRARPKKSVVSPELVSAAYVRFGNIVDQVNSILEQKWIPEKRPIEVVLLRVHHLLSPFKDESGPAEFDSAHHFDLPVDELDLPSQVETFSVAFQHLNSSISRKPLELGLRLQQDASKLRALETGIHAPQRPANLKSSLEAFCPQIPWLRFVVCPLCHTNYPVLRVLKGVPPEYTQTCTNNDEFLLRCRRGHGEPCGTALLDETGEPRMQLWYHPLADYISSLMSTAELEQTIDEHTAAMRLSVLGNTPTRISDIFKGNLVQQFKGPDGDFHFLDPEDGEGRLMFNFFIDGFNPEGGQCRGRNTSTTIVAAYCLNIPSAIRHLYPHPLMLIQGPHEVGAKYWSHYADHVVDDLKVGWY
jgi:hypothetical protein